MPLINANQAILNIANYRKLWLAGNVGTGKTLLAFLIARELVNRGYAKYIVSNIPSVWSDDPQTVLDNVRDIMYLDCVIILDEGGQFIKTAKQAAVFSAFPRKFNIYLILASVDPPAFNFKSFAIERTWKWSSFGIPALTYAYSLQTGVALGNSERTIQSFHLWKYSEMFGIYDTQAAPLDADDIVDMLDTHYVNVQQHMATKGKSLRLEGVTNEQDSSGDRDTEPKRLRDLGEEWGVPQDFSEAASQIESSISSFSGLLWQTHKKRKR